MKKLIIKKVILWVVLIVITTIFVPYLIVLNFFEYSIPPSLNKIKVFFEDENKVIEMNLDEYIIGVVSAEMPASFETEALKAQAVASRSYTVSKIKANKSNNSNNIHAHADICTSPAHCQAYVCKEEADKKWNKDAKKFYKKIKDAVLDTSDEIITYEGNVINAVFHASNGGKTENSKDVWGGNIPYLKSVESFGEENAPKYKSEISLSTDEFKKALLDEYPDIVFDKLIGKKELTVGGSVKEIEFGNKLIKGTDVRRIFNLYSANFDVKTDNNMVIFNVSGHGHGVGMSQYGANAMAKQGKSYIEILKNYYSNTEIATYIKP